MKSFITILLFVATLTSINCAQLNNNYLPPSGASLSGGSPSILQAPKAPSGGGSFAGANVPISQGRAPSQAPRPQAPGGGGSAAGAGPQIEIVSYENVNNGDGSYKWSYESANGIKSEETGDVKNKGSDNAIQTVQGSYSYTSPEGEVIQITYTADENGFQAIGDAIPTPVPLPEENLRAIAEFEAALATAVPDTASGSNPSQPSRPSSGAGPSQPPRPASVGSAQPSRPAGGSGPQFSNQPRPGNVGGGSYDSKSGYKY